MMIKMQKKMSMTSIILRETTIMSDEKTMKMITQGYFKKLF